MLSLINSVSLAYTSKHGDFSVRKSLDDGFRGMMRYEMFGAPEVRGERLS